MAQAALAWLASTDTASLPASAQAECLQALERIGSVHTAARSAMLRSFSTCGGYQDDGHRSAKAWLRWRTRVTSGSAGAAMAWMRRLAAHPQVGQALAVAEISCSWARQLCDWSDLLPEAARAGADGILLSAAADGADLADLASLAEEIRRRTADPDADSDDDGFAGRGLRLGVTFRGAGRLEGDLSAGCTAALSAVLDALGKRAGPEDLRTRQQRNHDALEEACRRIVAAGGLPERAGQPTQIQLHLTLDQLRNLPGAAGTEAAWASRLPAFPPGADCDATIIPVVSGHVDPDLLDQLTSELLRRTASPPPGQGPPGHAPAASPRGSPPGHSDPSAPDAPSATSSSAGSARPAEASSPGSSEPPGCSSPRPCTRNGSTFGRPGDTGPPGGSQTRTNTCARNTQARTDTCTRDTPDRTDTCAADARADLETCAADARGGMETCAADARGGIEAEALRLERCRRALREIVLSRAADLLSGPAGLAAYLRSRHLGGPASSVSLPLDIGAAAETIPVHLRRAVTARDRHCRFPGCDQPPSACQPHHIVHRAEGGSASVQNLLLLCNFHHLIVIHRWGWAITLHADGTTTATSPDRSRTYHSHAGPPVPAA